MRNQNDRFNQILKTLEKKLQLGEWKAGDRLPTLPILAKQFNVSVATVREVLRVLQSRGQISIEQGRGMFVNKDLMNMTNPQGDFAWIQTGGQIHDLVQPYTQEQTQSQPQPPIDASFSIKNLMQLIDVRSVLEPTFAETAAKQAFAEEISAILRSAERMAKLVESQENTNEEDLHFHLLIARATHNEIWIEIYEQLQGKLRAGRTHTNIPGMKEKAAHYHMMIAEAIRARDPEKAKMYMASHMEGNRELALFRLSKVYPEQH